MLNEELKSLKNGLSEKSSQSLIHKPLPKPGFINSPTSEQTNGLLSGLIYPFFTSLNGFPAHSSPLMDQQLSNSPSNILNFQSNMNIRFSDEPNRHFSCFTPFKGTEELRKEAIKVRISNNYNVLNQLIQNYLQKPSQNASLTSTNILNSFNPERLNSINSVHSSRSFNSGRGQLFSVEKSELPHSNCKELVVSEKKNKIDLEIEIENLDKAGRENIHDFKTCCNCKKTECIKLYCECFRAGKFCLHNCNCLHCKNRNHPSTLHEREKAIKNILTRNPYAFHKVEENLKNSESKGVDSEKQRIFRGCNCKKSGCIKKYCECFNAGIKCTMFCKCNNCCNVIHDGCLQHSSLLSQGHESLKHSLSSVHSLQALKNFQKLQFQNSSTNSLCSNTEAAEDTGKSKSQNLIALKSSKSIDCFDSAVGSVCCSKPLKASLSDEVGFSMSKNRLAEKEKENQYFTDPMPSRNEGYKKYNGDSQFELNKCVFNINYPKNTHSIQKPPVLLHNSSSNSDNSLLIKRSFSNSTVDNSEFQIQNIKVFCPNTSITN
jgi:hypothetical protein